MRDFHKLLVCGPAGAGKTTLIERVSSDFNVPFVQEEMRYRVIKYLKESGRDHIDREEMRPLYGDLISELPSLNGLILEYANDWPDKFFDPICRAFFGDGPGRIINVQTDFEECIRRMGEREYPTPERTVRGQYEYGSGYFQEAGKGLGLPTLIISGQNGRDVEYVKAKAFLETQSALLR